MLRTLIILGLLSAATSAPAAEPVDYLRDVKPLLAQRCYACHGALKQESSLRLDTAALVRQGGDSGSAVDLKDPAESLLLYRVSAKEMPPEGEPLTGEEIAILKRWIESGAKGPADEKPQQDPRRHWSYQTPVRPPVPRVPDADWLQNPIDAFIARRHREHGLTRQRPADKSVLLRRVYLDLVGIPPTRDELHAFLADPSPDAYEKVVDELLRDPRYGERWGRHWMDVWRYSDWYGRRGNNEIRYSQRHIWRWRDWIVESLNDDKGYDRMIVEMLAGDEIAPGDRDVLRATGFLGRNWYKFDRNVWLDQTIEHTSMGFLASTMKCARCHDHKFDPISQEEYYRLRAFFEPHAFRTDPLTAGTPTETDNRKNKVLAEGLSRVYDAKPEAPTYLFVRGDDRRPDKENPLTPAVPNVLGNDGLAIEPVELPVADFYPALRPEMVKSQLAQARAKLQTQEKALAKARTQLEEARTQRLAAASGENPETQLPTAKVFLHDKFDELDTDVWKLLNGNWTAADGHLAQSQVGSFLTIATLAKHPRDFRARVRYRTTDPGDIHSVGMSFDAVGTGDWQAIYTHVKGGSSAVHAFHRKGGRDTYPPEAIVPHSIKLNEPITLEFAVRGDLLNVWIDGELKLIHRMPLARQEGRFALWTHRGTAQFDELRIETLPEEIALASAAGEKVPSPFGKPAPIDWEQRESQRAREVALAEKRAETAQLEFTALEARITAERAKFAKAKSRSEDPSSSKGGWGRSAAQPPASQSLGAPFGRPQPPPKDAESLAKAASRAERRLALAQAAERLLQTEQALHDLEASAKPDEKALAAAKKKHAEATKAHASARAALEKESTKYTPLGETYPQTSTGRRLALARWIANPQNPRTARVAVNHIWLRHFGSALVESVSDFGLRSSEPTHPELLDWLAVELAESGWSMKHIHRLIVTSATYRTSSATAGALEPNLATDPNNRYLWRMNSRRLEAEAVRDSVLAVAGNLDTTMGGPDLAENLGQTLPRRSLYFRTTPDNKMPMLKLFDLANPNECYRRRESVVPQQALALSNSPLAVAQARALAADLAAELQTNDPAAFATAAFERVLGRAPKSAERAACVRFLQRETKLSGTTRARENLVHVLFNHTEFVTIR